MEKRTRIEELVDKLNMASEAYYSGGNEIMSNYEWDSLFDELVMLENETGIVLENSPTQTVGTDKETGKKEQHEYQALSLAKTKSVDELIKWAENRDIWLSWKLDGLTLVLTYDDGKLSKIVTRGNGTIGTNITHLKSVISGYPLNIDYKGHMVVRGEATISYTDFNNINDMIEDDDEKYANPRNLASGSLNLDNPEEVKKRHVEFNAFTLVHIDDAINSWGDRMEFLEKLGFTVVKRELCTTLTIRDAVNRWTNDVETGKMDIPVDGLVICYDDVEYSQTGSVTGHHATRAGLAFKWQDESVKSKLKYVEWSCAVSTISPVAVFEPVQIEGTTVSRASLCNLSEIERLDLKEEAEIEVIKANKIIPKVISSQNGIGDLKIPDVCPVCGAKTSIHISKTGTKTLHCVNEECSAKHVKRFERFVSKNGMDIEGLSVQTILRFMNEGFISDFKDIYELNKHYDTIKKLEGFGEKSCENLDAAIKKSIMVKAVNFIYSLCIPMIGLDAAKRIVSSLGFEEFVNRLEQFIPFVDIDGIGDEKSSSIINWYQDEKNQEEFKALLNIISITEGDKVVLEGGKCQGITFVITGDVHSFKNRSEFKAYVESEGGKVTGSVSKKTNYLVNNDIESMSAKNNKARELNIPIISEDEFIEKFGK
ncbi:NAD-dependent DNA ligase LigA [Lachnobacterium bovis]|uniref:NAD-dependent DNA ligase LigA n=1 Tax=Lachnobacterium bovis TaxID=140626 RepID=UPI0003B4CBA3|nr:NAD-dependent DNA ligase LigA [Lachnobacterium bovis]